MVINDVKLFATVYHAIYCRKFLMLSNQRSVTKSSALELKNISYFSIKTYVVGTQKNHLSIQNKC